MARPSDYSIELVTRICKEISTTSKGLKTICDSNDDFPCFATVYNWLNQSDKKEFLELYTRAKMDQADVLADEIIAISDDKTDDTIITDRGPIENKEWVNRSRLRIDARKWVASKLKPKKYGDKLDVTTDNKPLNQIDLSNLTFEQLKQLADSKSDQETSKD